MRTDSTLKAWLLANDVVFMADLVTLTLIDGTVYRWTTWDRPLTVGGNTFSPADGATIPEVLCGASNQDSRLTVDQMDLTLLGAGVAIGGKALTVLAMQGWFDGARVKVEHQFMPTPGDVTTLNSFILFEGRVGPALPQGNNVVLKLVSELFALNVLLPKMKLQPGCNNAVYDANCGLSRATFTTSGTASGTPTTTQVQSTTAGIIAKANGYYNLGSIKFTSGALSGQAVDVESFTVSGGTATFVLDLPLDSAPAAGDTFDVYPGCDLAKATCGTKFANLAQYRGYPHVPSPDAGAH